MFLDNEDFIRWMEKLSAKLSEIAKDLRALINTKGVLEDNDKILDNQDLALLLKVSFRTLQRYRSNGALPFFKINNKPYYRVADLREFIQKNCDRNTMQRYNDQTKDKT